MTAKAAICKALLLGRVLNIKNGFSLFGVTNIPREVSRSVEKDFGVGLNRRPRTGKTRFGVGCSWFDYRLQARPENIPGIKKMVEYILKIEGEPKTNEQARDQERIKKYLSL